MRQLVPIPIPSEKGVLVHTPPSLPAGLRQRLLSVAIALPLLTVGAVAAPVSAAVPTATPDTGITVEGRYHPAGAGCHGSDNADGCLSWGVRVPSTVAPNSSTTVTIEADSVPGQWTWSCPSPDGDRVAGTSAFYIDKGKDASRFTMTARNDSATPLSDFTISASRSRGQAQVTALTCDLTAFGGKVVSATGPAENLTVSSGTAKVPQGKDIACQVDLSGVVGRNTFKAALTTDGQTFSSDYTKDHPISEVKVQPTDRGVEADPTGTYEVEVGYSVTFTNNTDADGQTSNIVLHPRVPAGFTLKYVWGSGVPWWISMDDYAIQPDGSVPLSTEDTLHANSSTTMTFTTFYEVNAEAVTEDTWKALGTCDPKDPSKGLTTQIDVVGSDGVEPGTYSTCTTVTRTKN